MSAQLRHIKCLFFDTFGTVVDWRTSVTEALLNAAEEALKAPSTSMVDEVRLIASKMTYEDWGKVAQDWRLGYLQFTRRIADDPSIPYKTVDEIHLERLYEVLANRGLILLHDEPSEGSITVSRGSLWNESQIRDLNKIWHRLKPWPDTNAGLQKINQLGLTTCTLTNGNISLIEDMVAHAEMPFTQIFSAEMFQSYKPSAKVYLGAANRMGLDPKECAMVAAHLDDLKFAKSNGFAAIYVERPNEEMSPELGTEGFVDIRVSQQEMGFVTVAERLKEKGHVATTGA